MLPYVLLFIGSCFLLFLSGKWLIGSLTRIAKYLEWREFVVAFFIIAFAGSIPNLFIGISSAIHKIPQLSFGEIVGGNLINLTLTIAIAVFLSKGLEAKSKMVQTSAAFTVVIAILPLILILDGTLGRIDGMVLFLVFIFYIYWLFSKKERFSKVYDEKKEKTVKNFKVFIRDIGKLAVGIIILVVAADGMVRAAKGFSDGLGLPIALVGILVIGLANSIPEIYFAINASRKKQTWMVLGDLMGSVIICSTLVLGIVAMIYPIEIHNFSPFAIARFFLIIASIFFLFFVRTERKITKREGLFLLLIYIGFVITEIALN